MEIMRKAPERVLKLAMIDTMVRPDDEACAKARRGLLTLAQLGRIKGVTPQLLPKLVHPRCIGTAIADTVAAIGKEGFVRQQLAIIERPDYRPFLERVVVPSLIVVCESDVTPPVESEEIHRGIAPPVQEPLSDIVIMQSAKAEGNKENRKSIHA